VLERVTADGTAAPPVYIALARLHATAKDFEAQLDAIGACVAAHPDDSQILSYAVEALAPQMDDDLAGLIGARLHGTRQALMLARLHNLADRHDAALALLRADRADRPQDVIAQIAHTLHIDGRRVLARRYLARACRTWPGNATLRARLFHSYLGAAMIPEAIALTEAARTAGTIQPVDYHRDMCMACAYGGDIDAARDHLERFRRIAPAAPPPVSPLMRQYMGRGMHDDALAERRINPALTPEKAPHWRATLQGQLLSELEVDAAAGKLPDTAPMGLPALAAAVRARPGSSILATRFLQEWCDGLQDRFPPAPGREIPRVIYQYWDSPSPPPKVARLMQTWADAPGFDHVVLNRDSAVALLRSDYGPRWLRAFRMANSPAEAADLLRLALIARNGGIWADADDRLSGDLDRLIGGRGGLLLHQEQLGYSVGNNFFAAARGHPAIVFAAGAARGALLGRSNESAWNKTGPGLLSRAVSQFIAAAHLRDRPHDVKIDSTRTVEQVVNMHLPVSYKTQGGGWDRSGRGSGPVRGAEATARLKQIFGLADPQRRSA
jgi:hypothetical protein